MLKYAVLVFVSLSFGCFSGSLDIDASTKTKKDQNHTTNNHVSNNNISTSNNASSPHTNNNSTTCVSDRSFFNRKVNKILVEQCLGCHSETGIASTSKYILFSAGSSATYLERNFLASEKSAQQKNAAFNDRSDLILKPLKIEEHEGGKVFEENSEEAKILSEFIKRIEHPTDCGGQNPTDDNKPINMSAYDQLRRATLLLGARLPTKKEIEDVDKDEKALDAIYDKLLDSEAFFDLLEVGWSDLLHVRAIQTADSSLDRETYKDWRWWEAMPEGTKAEKKAKAKIRKYTNDGLTFGPKKLISYIVRNNKPFTEILTAPYQMVNPHAARAYGILDDLNFKDKNDPTEFLPAVIPTGGKTGIPENEDFYHSGLLSSSMVWHRFQTTPSNLNRARTRFFFKTFLGVDLLQLAPRAGDADKVVQFENPIRDFHGCYVCHSKMDPVAALFQNFQKLGYRQPYKGKWIENFDPGFNRKNLPQNRRKDPVRWLGEQTVVDPRFPVAMVENVYFVLTGREVLNPPITTENHFDQRQAAFLEQRKEVDRIVKLFKKDFNFKIIYKEWLKSAFFTTGGLQKDPSDKANARFKDYGLVSLITPENLSRKIRAIVGRLWWAYGDKSAISRNVGGRLINDGTFYYLFDGINSRELMRRLKTPSGINGAVTKIMAEDLACQNSARDFARPQNQRFLFPHVKIEDKNEVLIRKNLVYLHERILGERLKSDAPEIDLSFSIWKAVQEDGEKQLKNVVGYKRKHKVTQCIAEGVNDDDYTIRAWQSVLVFLFSDYKFFYL